MSDETVIKSYTYIFEVTVDRKEETSHWDYLQGELRNALREKLGREYGRGAITFPSAIKVTRIQHEVDDDRIRELEYA